MVEKARRRHFRARSGLRRSRTTPPRRHHQLSAGGIALIDLGQPRLAAGAQPKRRIGHLQRLEDALLEERAQRLSRQPFDDGAWISTADGIGPSRCPAETSADMVARLVNHLLLRGGGQHAFSS
jgi:hypothetical protein